MCCPKRMTVGQSEWQRGLGVSVRKFCVRKQTNSQVLTETDTKGSPERPARPRALASISCRSLLTCLAASSWSARTASPCASSYA
jgi:hypothetical protein